MLYYLVYSINRLIAILPLSFLYFLSDILFFPLYYVIRYRRKIVRRNLLASFPERSLLEIKKIEKQFYHYFCDYAVETIKLFHFSDKEMKKHLRFEGLDMLRKLYDENISCLMLLGHYGNWEWVSSLGIHVPKGYAGGQIYRPLKNSVYDRLFLTLRSRFGVRNIAKKDTLRAIMEYQKIHQLFFIGVMADQTPSEANIHYRTLFLNQDTPVLSGVERIAKKVNAVVLYLDVIREKRGYYVCSLKLLTKTPRDTAEFEITEKYMREMEKTILRQPTYWLWTHKRWKYSNTNSANSEKK